MKKRILALSLVIVLAVLTAACGKSKDKDSSEKKDGEEVVEEKETYQFKIWVGEEDISEEDGSWIKTRCDMFAAKYQDDEVLFDYAAFPEEEAFEKMNEDRTQAPDIFIFKSSQIDELVENRLLTRLWGKTEEYVLSSNTESIADLAMYQEKVYGIPISANPYILYYDKRVFTEEDVKSMDTILEKGVLSYPLEDEKYLKAFYEAKDVAEIPQELQDMESGEEGMEGTQQDESSAEETAGTKQDESSAGEAAGTKQDGSSAEGAAETKQDEPQAGEDTQQQDGLPTEETAEQEEEEEFLAKEDVDAWLSQFRASDSVVTDRDGTAGVEGMRNGTVQAAVYDYNSYPEMKEILGENLGMAALPVIHINGTDKQMKCVGETLNIGVNPDCKDFEMTIALATYLGSADSQQMHYDMSGVAPVNLTAVQTLMDLDLTRVIAQIADKEIPGWNLPQEDEEENK